MPHLLKLTAPMMGTRVSLHADQATWLLLEKREQLAATKLTAYDNLTILIDTVDLKDRLGEVDAYYGKL